MLALQVRERVRARRFLGLLDSAESNQTGHCSHHRQGCWTTRLTKPTPPNWGQRQSKPDAGGNSTVGWLWAGGQRIPRALPSRREKPQPEPKRPQAARGKDARAGGARTSPRSRALSGFGLQPRIETRRRGKKETVRDGAGRGRTPNSATLKTKAESSWGGGAFRRRRVPTPRPSQHPPGREGPHASGRACGPLVPPSLAPP